MKHRFAAFWITIALLGMLGLTTAGKVQAQSGGAGAVANVVIHDNERHQAEGISQVNSPAKPSTPQKQSSTAVDGWGLTVWLVLIAVFVVVCTRISARHEKVEGMQSGD